MAMARNAKKSGPLYRQLADALREAINASKYKVGEYLPSERELAEQHKVTRITVRGALRALEKEGLLSGEPNRCRRIVASPAERGTIELFFFKVHSPFSDPILTDFCTGVATQVQSMGYNLVLSHVTDDTAIERHLARMDRTPPRGIIVIGSYEWYGPVMQRMESKHPIVLVGTPHGSLRADNIAPDFEGAMAMAMGHLRSMGYERVKLLAGGFPEEEGRDQRNLESFRQTGLQSGFSAAQLSVFSTREVCGKKLAPHEAAGLWVRDDVLDGCKFPMAVVATAPSYAKNLLAIAQAKGLRVPKDVALICTQESRTLGQPPVPVTSVSIYGRNVGQHAVKRLEERLQSPSLPRRMERGEIQLIVRGSCGEPAATITASDADLQEELR
jgi:DNA-binding LacI/PurR family transcriptional regulator